MEKLIVSQFKHMDIQTANQLLTFRILKLVTRKL